MMLDEQQVQKLLRLKRFEQPPPGYFDRALEEFHRRQRAELLQRSALRIWWDRTTSALFTGRVLNYAYGGAFAVSCALATLVLSGVFNPASEPAVAPVAYQTTRTMQATPSLTVGTARLSLNKQFEMADIERASLRLAPSIAPSNSSLPRYVLDGRRPVSTEASFNF
ncbi:MAG: hypothetical protein JO069_20690 [Verrucomicrobia bacterium]|nr:hypothetical protein [Verrucomicrobiota bacterium]